MITAATCFGLITIIGECIIKLAKVTVTSASSNNTLPDNGD
jgi:hypothetical protein